MIERGRGREERREAVRCQVCLNSPSNAVSHSLTHSSVHCSGLSSILSSLPPPPPFSVVPSSPTPTVYSPVTLRAPTRPGTGPVRCSASFSFLPGASPSFHLTRSSPLVNIQTPEPSASLHPHNHQAPDCCCHLPGHSDDELARPEAPTAAMLATQVERRQ